MFVSVRLQNRGRATNVQARDTTVRLWVWIRSLQTSVTFTARSVLRSARCCADATRSLFDGGTVRKKSAGLLSLVLAAGLGSTLTAPAVSATPTPTLQKSAITHDHPDEVSGHEMPNPLEDKRRALREQALTQVLSGEATIQNRGGSKVVKVSNGKAPEAVNAKGQTTAKASKDPQYVELSREKTDRIFVVLAEFGNRPSRTRTSSQASPARPRSTVRRTTRSRSPTAPRTTPPSGSPTSAASTSRTSTSVRAVRRAPAASTRPSSSTTSASRPAATASRAPSPTG
jgi:hypothetical protein